MAVTAEEVAGGGGGGAAWRVVKLPSGVGSSRGERLEGAASSPPALPAPPAGAADPDGADRMGVVLPCPKRPKEGERRAPRVREGRSGREVAISHLPEEARRLVADEALLVRRAAHGTHVRGCPHRTRAGGVHARACHVPACLVREEPIDLLLDRELTLHVPYTRTCE